MGDYTLARTIELPYDEAVAAVRSALGEQGFGVLTEIDLAATLHAKIGAVLPPQVILGACRPQLAHEALQADPSVAAMLPCNVVVRSVDEHTTVVEAFDPDLMTRLTGEGADSPLAAVATDARERLRAMLTSLA